MMVLVSQSFLVVKMILLRLMCHRSVTLKLINTDDGSCYPFIYGCNDPYALNFNDYDEDGLYNLKTGVDTIDINTDDGSCIPIIYGCTDSTMYNYNPSANLNNDVCYPIISGCVDDETALNFIADSENPYLAVNDTVDCILPLLGCMDSLAFNYDEFATVHDDSVLKKFAVVPIMEVHQILW